MAPPKAAKKKQQAASAVFDGICYMTGAQPPSRCSADRLNVFVECVSNLNVGESFYEFVYTKKKAGTYVGIGSVGSLEEALRMIDRTLAAKEYAGKKIGDLVLLTHGKPWLKPDAKKTTLETIDHMRLVAPMFSMEDPDGSSRTLPKFYSEVSSDLAAGHIEKLCEPGSDYYQYQEGIKGQDGLMSKIAPRIAGFMDSDSHLWLAGCGLGFDRRMMKAMRKLFSDKPTVYGFRLQHYIWVHSNSSGDVDGGKEYLYTYQQQPLQGILLWSKDGLKEIVHEP